MILGPSEYVLPNPAPIPAKLVVNGCCSLVAAADRLFIKLEEEEEEATPTPTSVSTLPFMTTAFVRGFNVSSESVPDTSNAPIEPCSEYLA
jgi:hypothetical protein